MAAHVPDEVGSDAPLYETPHSIGPLEAVVVPTTDDGLERQAGHRLERGEVRGDTAVPGSSSTSMARLVVRCFVWGVPSS